MKGRDLPHCISIVCYNKTQSCSNQLVKYISEPQQMLARRRGCNTKRIKFDGMQSIYDYEQRCCAVKHKLGMIWLRPRLVITHSFFCKRESPSWFPQWKSDRSSCISVNIYIIDRIWEWMIRCGDDDADAKFGGPVVQLFFQERAHAPACHP